MDTSALQQVLNSLIERTASNIEQAAETKIEAIGLRLGLVVLAVEIARLTPDPARKGLEIAASFRERAEQMQGEPAAPAHEVLQQTAAMIEALFAAR